MSVPYDNMAIPGATEPKSTYIDEPEDGPRFPLLDYLDQGNIVSKIPEPKEAANKTAKLYAEAKESMAPWLKKYNRAINLAKLQPTANDQPIESKSFPFEGASLVMMPYILEAMLDFSSRAAPELVWADTIIHPHIYGENNKAKDERAKRVGDYSNYQLKELMPEWQDEQDKGLLTLPNVGTTYKKTYYNYDTQEICSDLCLADQVIFNHDYKSFDVAPDKFQVLPYTRNDVIGFIRGTQEWDIKEKELEEDKEDFEFIEAYTWIDMDEDGLKEPYIAILWEEKERIVALYPLFDEDTLTYTDDGDVIKITPTKVFTQYKFLPDPEGGPMGLGWGILLGPMFDAINTDMRQLLDSGTLNNTAANSGLITQSLASGRGNAVQSGPIDLVLGELTPIPNHGSGNLRDNIVQFPFAGPSPTLFQLLQYLIDSSRQMTNAAINVEANPGEAASLYAARLQQGLKVPNSIIMRVYNACKKEFQLIGTLNHKHFDDKKYNKVLDSKQQASMEQDFNPDDCDIRMAADPTQGSDIERVQRAQATLDLATTQTSQVINYREAMLNVLKAMKHPDMDTIAPEPDPNQRDPMQDLMMAQQAAEMELRKEDQRLRAEEITIKKQRSALDAAKEATSLGLQADKEEAEIQALYVQSLERMMKLGLSSGQANNIISQVEDTYIGDTGEGTEIPTDDISPDGDMASEPSDGGLPALP